jgi:hypothetical protein
MAKNVNKGNFIRIHMINRIIQRSCLITKDLRSNIVIGLNNPIELESYPKFLIRGLRQNGLPITKSTMSIGWFSFSDIEILNIFNQLKNEHFFLTDKFEEKIEDESK